MLTVWLPMSPFSVECVFKTPSEHLKLWIVPPTTPMQVPHCYTRHLIAAMTTRSRLDMLDKGILMTQVGWSWKVQDFKLQLRTVHSINATGCSFLEFFYSVFSGCRKCKL